ncbi:phycobilisome linker polypeptide [Leptolyngbya sp. 'hensonii']|uniref:phycobilisome linker polypeptide n=1 Tax=Leptolyngbya sp. 'hensonii' TaxID=1922337 RepID=UPI00094F93B4|nr:phycobilisome linker polypeptide [Leptolyngbya sp. 'hensonii']OLP19329.1 phycobilisome linker polypeptide [Leptolyngbya sp. 'hensonii']
MLGPSVLVRASGSSSENRTFVYEVTGLRQNDQTDNNGYPVRHSSTTLIQVPFSRMNEEMQRISRLGGTIVGIRPLQAVPAAPAPEGEG